MRKVLAVAAVMSMAAVAPADLMVDVQLTATLDVTGVGTCSQYTVYFTTDSNDYASAFDGRFDGQMVQYWDGRSSTEVMDDAVYLDEVFPPDGISKDTHLLLWLDDLVFAHYPREDGNRNGPNIGTWFASGTGGIDNMAIGIKGTAQQGNLPFVQLVIPASKAQVHMVGSIGRANRDTGIGVDIWIPEPATVGLLAVGGVALVTRRRRR